MGIKGLKLILQVRRCELYEEYHPYGTTAWRAPELSEVSAKRYKYTGMERDEETGLQCHGVRYYCCWLGRWVSADPIGLEGSINVYRYASMDPILWFDSSGLKDDWAYFTPDKPQKKEHGGAPPTAQTSLSIAGGRTFEKGGFQVNERAATKSDIDFADAVRRRQGPTQAPDLLIQAASATLQSTIDSNGNREFGAIYYLSAAGTVGIINVGEGISSKAMGSKMDDAVRQALPKDAVFVVRIHSHPTREDVLSGIPSPADIGDLAQDIRSSGTIIVSEKSGPPKNEQDSGKGMTLVTRRYDPKSALEAFTNAGGPYVTHWNSDSKASTSNEAMAGAGEQAAELGFDFWVASMDGEFYNANF